MYFACGNSVVCVVTIHVAFRCPDTGFFCARRVKLDRADILQTIWCLLVYYYLFVVYLFKAVALND